MSSEVRVHVWYRQGSHLGCFLDNIQSYNDRTKSPDGLRRAIEVSKGILGTAEGMGTGGGQYFMISHFRKDISSARATGSAPP